MLEPIKHNHSDLSLRLSPEYLENLIQTDGWMEHEDMRALLLKDEKTLTLEYIEDDYIFFLFYLYGKSRNKPLQQNSVQEYKRDMKVLLDFLADPAKAFNDVGFADPAPPPCRLKDIGRLQLRAYERYIKERYAPNSAVRKLSFVKSILRFAYEKDFVAHNFRDEFAIGRKVVSIAERKLNYDELQALLNELRKKPLHRIIGSLLILKGLRVSELCGINNGDIESGLYGDTMVRLRRKGGKVARKKIPKNVMYDIMMYRDELRSTLRKRGLELNESPEAPFIPNKNGNRLFREHVWGIVKRAAIRAGKDHPTFKKKAKDVSPHWIRHSFATIALDAGASIQDVKDELGHEDIRTTQIYLHSLKEETGSTIADLINTKVHI